MTRPAAGGGDHVQGALVAEGRTDPLEDPGHGLDVVGQHLGARGEHLGQLVGVAVEVGDQVLHAGAGVELVDDAHRLGVQPGSAVGQVVAGDAGDGGVAQAHGLHRLRHPAGLVAVQRLGLAGVDLAEVAAPGALVAADEEGGLAVLPALVDVGAAGLLAHRVEALGLHQALELLVLRAHLGPGLDPLRLALDRSLGVADLQAQELAPVGPDVGRRRCLSHTGDSTPVSQVTPIRPRPRAASIRARRGDGTRRTRPAPARPGHPRGTPCRGCARPPAHRRS